ncbi:hypothetical protein NL676_032693, partial [Syzygium grande]
MLNALSVVSNGGIGFIQPCFYRLKVCRNCRACLLSSSIRSHPPLRFRLFVTRHGAVMMGERRIRLLAAAQALTVLLIGFQICASDVIFYDSFDESFEGRWVVSEKEDYQ